MEFPSEETLGISEAEKDLVTQYLTQKIAGVAPKPEDEIRVFMALDIDVPSDLAEKVCVDDL